MLDFDKKARTADYNSRHESYPNDTRVTRWDRKRHEDLYKQSNMLLKRTTRTNFDGLAMA